MDRAELEEAGMSGVYLEQLYTFGQPGKMRARRFVSNYALVLPLSQQIDEIDDRRVPIKLLMIVAENLS